jgi:DNA-binding CsgD family transcriptional regulator
LPIELLEFVGAVYEAASLPELWSNVLDGLAALVGARGGLLLTANIDQDVRWISSPSLNEVTKTFIREGWATRNVRGARLAPMRYPGFVADTSLLTEEEMRADPFYQDLLARYGLRRGAGTMIQIPNGDIIAITVEGEIPISPEAITLLDSIRPHLARSALMAARMRLERAKSAVEVLERIGLAAAVVYPNRRVLLANDLIGKLDGSVNIARFDRLTLAHPPSNQMLVDTLGGIVRGSLSGVMSIPIPAVDLAAPLVVHVLPVTGSAQDIFAGGLAIIIVTPVVMPGINCADILDTLFDLTPAEARIAALVGSGLTPRIAAQKLNITEETARSALKRVFSKAGVSRQSELTALLGTLLLRKSSD